MINYILLVITVACTIFNLWLTLSDRQGYDKGLEDGIRMTNEVLKEDKQDEPQTEKLPPYLIRDQEGYLDEFEVEDERQTDCSWR